MSTVVFTIRSLPAFTLERLTFPDDAVTGAERAALTREALLSAAARMPSARTWHDVWGELTGPRGGRGYLLCPQRTCGTCRGRRFAASGAAVSRAVNRGLPAGTCPDCQGTGKAATLRLRGRPVEQ
jgi:hypothetical protein